jgi:hypothetical protein
MKTQVCNNALYHDWLQDCQQNFGAEPLSWPGSQLSDYLSISQPAWAKRDRLNVFFKCQKQLLITGRLSWGSIVQANNHLFNLGKIDYPADALYLLEAGKDEDPETLLMISSKCFGLKGTKPKETDLAKIAQHLTNEYDRTYELLVPPVLSWDVPCAISTIYIPRKHLPNGYLSQKLFPLIINRQEPKVAMILPSRYWPAAMVDWWIGD